METQFRHRVYSVSHPCLPLPGWGRPNEGREQCLPPTTFWALQRSQGGRDGPCPHRNLRITLEAPCLPHRTRCSLGRAVGAGWSHPCVFLLSPASNSKKKQLLSAKLRDTGKVQSPTLPPGRGGVSKRPMEQQQHSSCYMIGPELVPRGTRLASILCCQLPAPPPHILGQVTSPWGGQLVPVLRRLSWAGATSMDIP